MPTNRPPAIEIPDHPTISRATRFFARASGQEFCADEMGGVRRIDLYDEISHFGVSAKDFRAQLRGAGDVVLRINSPGGDVTEGLAIFADLVAHPGKITVEIVGIAASIASVIAMAGDSISIAPQSFMMIHNSHALSIGDTRTHSEVADILKKIDGQLAATYSARSGADERKVRAWMAAETWFTASEAKEAGLVNEITTAAEPKAKFDLSVYSKTPAELLAAFAPNDIDPNSISNRRDYEAWLRDAGMSRSRAKALAAGYRSTDHRDDDSEERELAAHIHAQASFIESFSRN